MINKHITPIFLTILDRLVPVSVESPSALWSNLRFIALCPGFLAIGCHFEGLQRHVALLKEIGFITSVQNHESMSLAKEKQTQTSLSSTSVNKIPATEALQQNAVSFLSVLSLAESCRIQPKSFVRFQRSTLSYLHFVCAEDLETNMLTYLTHTSSLQQARKTM